MGALAGLQVGRNPESGAVQASFSKAAQALLGYLHFQVAVKVEPNDCGTQ